MSGFPARTTYRALGGTRTNAFPVTRPDQEVDMRTWNDVQWIAAAMSRLGPLVRLRVAADGSRLAGAEAWNDLDVEAKRVTITHDTTGEYQITCAATYPDWDPDTSRPVEFHGAWIQPMGATSVRPPTFTLDNPTQITIYTFNAAGAAADVAFCVAIW